MDDGEKICGELWVRQFKGLPQCLNRRGSGLRQIQKDVWGTKISSGLATINVSFSHDFLPLRTFNLARDTIS